MPATSTEKSAVTRLHALVHGRVQGVGYRYWMHHTAHRFPAITGGRVRNLLDDTVEVEAESSDRDVLEALLIELFSGPTAAQVEKVDATWEEDVLPRYSGPFRVS